MRLTEYFSAVKEGIGEEEQYSHLDITDLRTRETITQARREIKKMRKSIE